MHAKKLWRGLALCSFAVLRSYAGETANPKVVRFNNHVGRNQRASHAHADETAGA
jgi:hypothetical protein